MEGSIWGKMIVPAIKCKDLALREKGLVCLGCVQSLMDA